MHVVRRAVTVAASVAVALATFTIVPAAPAQAADNGSWAIVPASSSANVTSTRAFFNIESAAGQTIRDAVTISNITTEPLTLELYPADAYNAPGGGFALTGKDKPVEDIGSWVTVDRSTITIPPQKQTDVGFTMVIPADASPGDHAGGIVALNPLAEATEETADGAVVRIQQAVGVRIYSRIQGPLRAEMAVTSVDLQPKKGGIPGLRFPKTGTVTYVVKNTGNVRLTTDGVLKLTGLFGRTLSSTEPESIPEILPGQETTLSFGEVDLPPVDRVKATVTLTNEEYEVNTSGDDVAWIFPWLLLLVIAAGVIAWFVWRRFVRQRLDSDDESLTSIRKRSGEHAAEAVR